jgi:uncharacterized membrane protein YgdD (TMEM256/DUF423 family)
MSPTHFSTAAASMPALLSAAAAHAASPNLPADIVHSFPTAAAYAHHAPPSLALRATSAAHRRRLASATTSRPLYFPACASPPARAPSAQ